MVFPLSCLFWVHSAICVFSFSCSCSWNVGVFVLRFNVSKTINISVCTEMVQPVARACLFTELSRQFAFVWSHVIEHRSLIMESPPPFCSFNPSLISSPPLFALQLFLFSLVYFQSKMLGQIQTCTHFTSTRCTMLVCLHFLLNTADNVALTQRKHGSNKEP